MRYKLNRNDLGNLYVAPVPVINFFNTEAKTKFFTRLDDSLGRDISNKWFEPSWQSYASQLFRIIDNIDP